MKSDKITLYISIGILILLLVLILTNSTSGNTCSAESFDDSKSTNNKINDMNKVDLLKCSHSCCLSNGYPYPFNVTDPNIPDEELKNYIPSNFSCNWGSSGGCVCFTKDNYDYLANHGAGVTPPLSNYGYTYAS